jgi:hypothetical protein
MIFLPCIKHYLYKGQTVILFTENINFNSDKNANHIDGLHERIVVSVNVNIWCTHSSHSWKELTRSVLWYFLVFLCRSRSVLSWRMTYTSDVSMKELGSWSLQLCINIRLSHQLYFMYSRYCFRNYSVFLLEKKYIIRNTYIFARNIYIIYEDNCC